MNKEVCKKCLENDSKNKYLWMKSDDYYWSMGWARCETLKYPSSRLPMKKNLEVPRNCKFYFEHLIL